MRLILLASILSATTTPAWLRDSYEDAVVVERSEVIVEGRLIADSIQYVPHDHGGENVVSGEHHATLVVEHVHKGELRAKEILIIIHYGLIPRVTQGKAIELWDSGNSLKSPRPEVENLAATHLWFLRRIKGIYGEAPSTGNLGIRDPEDVAEEAFRDYYLAYMKGNPGNAVRDIVSKRPELLGRARSYLDHLEIPRILGSGSTAEQIERLMPFFIKRHQWRNNYEADNALASLGDPAGAALYSIFEKPEHQLLRPEIIDTWGKMKYSAAIGILDPLLRDQDKYWGAQDLKRGWWNRDPGSSITEERQRNYSLVHAAIRALGSIGNLDGRGAVELTRTRWFAIAKATNEEWNQITGSCEESLNALDAKK